MAAEADEAEDIRLKPQITRACAASAAALCAGVEPGGAALLECLQLKAAHPEMDGACAAQMTRYAKRASRHMAFNTMVKKHCPADAERLLLRRGFGRDFDGFGNRRRPPTRRRRRATRRARRRRRDAIP